MKVFIKNWTIIYLWPNVSSVKLECTQDESLPLCHLNANLTVWQANQKAELCDLVTL